MRLPRAQKTLNDYRMLLRDDDWCWVLPVLGLLRPGGKNLTVLAGSSLTLFGGYLFWSEPARRRP